MNTVLTSEIQEVIGAVHYRPAVSVIIPVEPKINLKNELSYVLKTATNKVEKLLRKDYPDEISRLVLNKLEIIIKNLNYSTEKKSIAIYISPVFEKVFYLDIPVEEKVIVDESFEIRDLVYSKKQLHKYLVLLISGKESKIFLGNTTTFVRIVTDTPESINAYVNDAPGRVANFSDVSQRKEILMEKFLHHTDNSLDSVLNIYHLPLFVLGSERMLGHFKHITKHKSAVIEYVQGNYEEAGLEQLKKLLQPHIADWQRIKQKSLMNLLEDAAGKKKLATGIKDVWHEAMNHKGRLLMLEKNYMYASQHGSGDDMIDNVSEPYHRFSIIKDAVDDIIEKVLENGGDVEFVDEGVLKDHHHIALILFY